MKNLLYWEGFLLADGCMTTGSRGKPRFCLEIKGSDEKHIWKFKEDWEIPTKPQIYTRKLKGDRFVNRTATTIKISTQHPEQITKLKKRCQWDNKTFGAKANKQQSISAEFWRGIIDGDGCLSCRLEPSRSRTVPKITLTTGSEELINQWQQFIYEKCETEAKYHERKRGKAFDLKVTGNKALHIVTFLYKNAKISLDRKQTIAEEIMSLSWKKKQED